MDELYDENLQVYKQVRIHQGGETCHLKLSKEASSEEVLKEGKRLFFPDGGSIVGKENDFDFYVQDFRGITVANSNCTVNDLYQQTEVKMLRLYVCTRHKEKNGSSDFIDLDETLPFI